MFFDFRNTEKLANLNEQVKIMEAAISDKDSQIQALTDNLNERDSKIQSLEFVIEEMTAKIQEMETAKENLNQIVQEQEQKIDVMTDIKAASLLASIGHEPIEEKPVEENELTNLFKDYKNNRDRILAMVK